MREIPRSELKVGDPAPDATLRLLSGRGVRLSHYWREAKRALALVFVRHWG